MRTMLVAGALANKPGNGGEAWVRLSWVLGLRRLGIDAWLVEQLDPASCVDQAGRPSGVRDSVNLSWFRRVIERFGLGGRAALVDPAGRWLAGVQTEALEDELTGTELLINISGNLTAPSLLGLGRRRAYVDLDPGYTQFWHRDGALNGSLERHEHLLTVALGIGAPGCAIPTNGSRWRAVAPPVVLDEWPACPPAVDGRFTTVASWRGGYGRLEADGHQFGQKAHEFRRFAEFPTQSGVRCEAALEIHPGDAADAERLRAGGWRLADPRSVAGDPDAFRRYVQGSLAELSPAQGVYVETRSGWFSDRSTRYLASGRPAIVQATGLPSWIPTGEGLLTFTEPTDAAAAARAVLSDYERHGRAARALAEELFGSDRVLTALLEDLLP